jgi:hypothetical protein
LHHQTSPSHDANAQQNQQQQQQQQQQAHVHLQQQIAQQQFDQVNNGYDSNLKIDPNSFISSQHLIQQQHPQQSHQQGQMDSPLTTPYDLMRNGMQSQYLMPQQNASAAGAYNQSTYYPEPYLSIPLQTTYMQPYFGMQPTAVPPHSMIYHQIQQQQQQQQLSTSPGNLASVATGQIMKSQSGRPLSPQQGQQQTGQQQDQNHPYGFPYYATNNAYAAYDQNAAAQLMMSNARNINQVRMVSPMLINANGNQNNFFG